MKTLAELLRRVPETPSANLREALQALPEPSPPDHAGERIAQETIRAKLLEGGTLHPGIKAESHLDDSAHITALCSHRPVWSTQHARNDSESIRVSLRELLRAYELTGWNFDGERRPALERNIFSDERDPDRPRRYGI